MNYPTIEQVNAADRYTICGWHRFLPSPGMSVIDNHPERFEEVLKKEAAIMDRIQERLKEFGGFTPEISKSLGWER